MFTRVICFTWNIISQPLPKKEICFTWNKRHFPIQNLLKIMPRMSSLSVSLVRLSILNRASLTCIDIISKSFPDILASACVAFFKWFFCLSFANKAPLPADAIFFILSLSFFSSSISLFLCFREIVIFGRIPVSYTHLTLPTILLV